MSAPAKTRKAAKYNAAADLDATIAAHNAKDAAPHNSSEAVAVEPVPEPLSAKPGMRDVPIRQVSPSALNPRQHFDDAELADLAASIKEHGLLEPIVVRLVDRIDTTRPGRSMYLSYEIIAGERRYRAATLAGCEWITVRVLDHVDDQKAITLAIIENLHRADLNPIEEARGYAMLRDQGLTQGAIGDLVKKSQPQIAKALGMLKLPDDVQELIRQGTLSPAHAAALERFKEFPAYVSGVAAMAARNATPSKQLQEEKIPFGHSLDRENGPIRVLSPYSAGFDVGICTKCPYNAYRLGQNDQGYCLRPEHFDELQAAAEAAKLAGQKAAIAAAVEAAGVDVDALPIVQKIRGPNSVEFYSWQTPAAGCSAECPCSIQALDENNGQLIRVCTDRARHTKLAEKEKNAARIERNAAGRVIIDGMKQRLDALPAAIGIHELVLLIGPLLRGITHKGAWREALERQLPGTKLGMQAMCKAEDLLALDAAAFVRFAVDVVITSEQHVAAAYEWGTPRTPNSDWYKQFCGVPDTAVEAWLKDLETEPEAGA